MTTSATDVSSSSANRPGPSAVGQVAAVIRLTKAAPVRAMKMIARAPCSVERLRKPRVARIATMPVEMTRALASPRAAAAAAEMADPMTLPAAAPRCRPTRSSPRGR